jgi:hydroxymethylpyrimidine/phosphomethylpyrimidine kinase
MREAARFICLELGAGAALVKGGHLEGAPVDILYDGRAFQELRGRRLTGPAGAFHGTGCILSSAAAAGLIRGLELGSAVEEAKRYTEKTLEKRIRLLGG